MVPVVRRLLWLPVNLVGLMVLDFQLFLVALIRLVGRQDLLVL